MNDCVCRGVPGIVLCTNVPWLDGERDRDDHFYINSYVMDDVIGHVNSILFGEERREKKIAFSLSIYLYCNSFYFHGMLRD